MYKVDNLDRMTVQTCTSHLLINLGFFKNRKHAVGVNS